MKILNVTLLSVFLIQLSFSQTLKYADGSSQNMSNVFVNVNSNQSSTIKGSKYLNEDFISTKISSMPDQIFGVRYNVYDDQMEFQGIDNTVYSLNKDDDSIKITFTATNESYSIFSYIDDNGRKKKGYFIKLNNDGENLILKKHRVVFYEEQASKTGYDTPKPAMYKNMKDRIYIKLANKEAVLLPTKKKKLVKELFPKNPKIILDFINSNKIKLSNEADLITFINYLNTL
ncbi:MAG: hypothetical protein HN714_00095 [Formosa sp.]|jgi:hypothetical protein|nr:hypothetical protein [Formosa sp.]